jgi:hypothetical protein
MIWAGKPMHIMTLGDYPDQASINPGNLHPFPLFFQKKEGTIGDVSGKIIPVPQDAGYDPWIRI